MTVVFEEDFGGAVDTVSVVNAAFLDKVVSFSVNSFVTLNSTLTSSCNAGTPIQGNMRQAAADRWNYMYPS